MDKKIKDRILSREHELEKFSKRIVGLQYNGYFIEAFLLQFSMIEDILIKIIKEYGKISESVLIEGKINFNFKEIHGDSLNKVTFGKLIHYFKIFNKDSLLIEKLESLNSLRIKCVHGIFSSDIDRLNTEVKTQISGHQKLIGYLLDFIILDLMIYPDSIKDIPRITLD